MLQWGRGWDITAWWELGLSQRTSEGGPHSGVALQHPGVSSECGAHGLCVVKANPAACHCSPQEEELFSPPLPYSSSDKVSSVSCPFVPRDGPA